MSVKRHRVSEHTAPTHGYPQQSNHDSPIIPDYDPRSQNHSDNEVSSFSRSTGSQKRNPPNHAHYPPPTFAQPLHEPSSHPGNLAAAPKRSRDVAYDSLNYSNTGRRVASDPMAVRDRISNTRPYAEDAVDGTPRRASVSHKSPLQKLEGVLDGRSKEERRARVAEAELAAHDKSRRSGSTRIVSGGDAGDRRHSRSGSGAAYPPPIADHRSRGAAYALTSDADAHQYSGKSYNIRGTDTLVTYGNAGGHRSSSGQHVTSDLDYAPAPPPKDIARADSRRLQKQPPQDRRASNSDRNPALLNTSLPVRSSERTDRDYINGSSPAVNSSYHTPPQEAADKYQSRSAGAVNLHDVQEHPHDTAATQHGFRLPHIFHRHRDGRRYKEGAVISDWKQVPTLSLTAADLQLQSRPSVASSDPDDRPWWDKSVDERTGKTSRKSAVAAYGPNVDARSGQTYFKPPIYLKCGPLLRFRGIYSEPSRSDQSSSASPKEIWRGSIMIVTIDSKSRYETAPTLRLFKQSVDLLPPPPTEVREGKGQELSPEYVDPIAGQVKASRVGKTLYVRPVEQLDEGVDLSRREDDSGLFEEKNHASVDGKTTGVQAHASVDGEQVGKVKEVQGARLFAERGCTFWKFNIDIELGPEQQRIAYRINRGPATGFWVPARGQNMNIMFHSCNGFSLSVDTAQFSGPDPLWRDVLNSHQTRPFHVMLGGGDQIYMDAATRNTKLFKEWAEMKNAHHKHTAPFTVEMQEELEKFYLDRYAMWFSSGFFGMANSQIPMVNIWDDHDIMDGYGSYPDSTMSCPVFTGVGAVAFKYYMLFQHQTVPEETEVEEPSWVLGFQRGPYIQQRSRSVFMSLGSSISLLGLDCRTERTRDLILSEQTWEHAFQRLETELVKGKTKHLIVLLGVPIAYPRLNFLENVLTSRVMDPVKAIGRTGALGGFVNKFDGGVEILDDLDDHWTAKHHKDERNWFIQELQYIAASKSVRITILGGDVHLAAVGRFFSNGKLNIPKDRDHRYMPNVVSSAIVNTPPGDMVADVLNRRDKIHHLDDFTDENMIPLFTVDTDGKPRNNKTLLPRRNWCSIRDYIPSESPEHSPEIFPQQGRNDIPNSDKSSMHSNDTRKSRASITDSIRRSFSETRQKISGRLGRSKAPPMAFYNKTGGRMPQNRTSSADAIGRRTSLDSTNDPPGSAPAGRRSFSINDKDSQDSSVQRPNRFVRVPTGLSEKQARRDTLRGGAIDLTDGLTIHINAENVRGDPAGTTTDYHFMVPALDFAGVIPPLPDPLRKAKGIKGLFGTLRRAPVHGGSVGGSSGSIAGTDVGAHERPHVNGDTFNGWADDDGTQHHTAPNRQPTAETGRPSINNHQPRKSLDEGLFVSRVRGNNGAAANAGNAATVSTLPKESNQAQSHSRKSSRGETLPSAAITSSNGNTRSSDTRLADGRQIRHPHHPEKHHASDMSDIDLVHGQNGHKDRHTYDDYETNGAPNAKQDQNLQEHRKKRGSFAAKAAAAVRGGLAYARRPQRRYPEDFDDDRYYTDEEAEAEEEERRRQHQAALPSSYRRQKYHDVEDEFADDRRYRNTSSHGHAGPGAVRRDDRIASGGGGRHEQQRYPSRRDDGAEYHDDGYDDGYDSPSQEVDDVRRADGGAGGRRKSSWKFWKSSGAGAGAGTGAGAGA